MIHISERPAEVEDRAVPGHWDGDLIFGKADRSEIGTLVERSTRFVMLLHLPDGYDALQVRDRMIETTRTLPAQLRRSLTWDRGNEMARHAEITLATAELNGRPRQTLGWLTPAQSLNPVFSGQSPVATTT
jgi:IS30 family transposase